MGEGILLTHRAKPLRYKCALSGLTDDNEIFKP